MTDDIKKVSQNRAKKEGVVAQLSETIDRAKGLVFTNYQGLTHKQIEDLKKSIKPLDADFSITKNTLLKIALEQKNLKVEDEKGFEGPTGTLFLYGDVIEPLKKLAKTIKDLNLPTIKFAIIDGKVTSGEDVIKLSSLPSREVLLAQIAAGLKSPISGLHRALNWNLQKLVMTLSAIQANRPQTTDHSSQSSVGDKPLTEPAAEQPEATTQTADEPEAATEAEPSQSTSEQPESKQTVSEGGEN